jgi:hypothetical protein
MEDKKTPRTWDDVNSLDDCVIPEEKKILRELKIEKTCPELGKVGQYFYFCKKDYAPKDGDKLPSPSSPIYQRKVDLAFLQLYCIGGECKNCCTFKGELKR